MTRWRAFLALIGVGLAGPVVPATAQERPRPVDARMLLDLELLREGDLERQRAVWSRLELMERLRVLESMPVLESDTPLGGTDRPGGKEVKER